MGDGGSRKCFFCDNDIQIEKPTGAYDSIDCSCCGKYVLSYATSTDLAGFGLTRRNKANISGYLYENAGFEINEENIKTLLNLKSPSFHEKADKLLLMFERKTDYAGDLLSKEKNWISTAWCMNLDELAELLDFLEDTKRLHFLANLYKIAPKGWAHLEEIKKVNQDSQQGFVAMWFDDSMTAIYDDCIHPAVENAGYKAKRVDREEHANKIDDEIIAQIRQSRFVVADFTGQRGGVYYEAGYAHGLGLEVIWTCWEDYMKKLHFDIRQYNFIVWDEKNLDEFARNLTNRIEAVLGKGTYQAGGPLPPAPCSLP